jgi:hypothetical protein
VKDDDLETEPEFENLSIFREDPVDVRDAVAVFPSLVPAAVPVDRFTIALAPACALAEPSREPCSALFVPARREEAAVPLARVAGSTLLTVPFAFLTWLVNLW